MEIGRKRAAVSGRLRGLLALGSALSEALKVVTLRCAMRYALHPGERYAGDTRIDGLLLLSKPGTMPVSGAAVRVAMRRRARTRGTRIGQPSPDCICT